MNSSRIALLAAAAAAALWTAKALAIGLAGGLDQSPLESPLFIAGFLCFVVGVAALGAALARRATVPLRLLAGLGALVAGVVYAVLLSMVIDGLVEPTDGRHWAWAELGLWIGALTLLVATAATARRQTVVH